MKISEFEAKIIQKGGILKPSKFTVNIHPPENGGNFAAYRALLQGGQDLTFFAEEAVLPGVALQNDDNRRYGYGIMSPNPHNVVFTDIPLTMRSDVDGDVWGFFHAWMSSAINYQVSTGGLAQQDESKKAAFELGYKDEYAATVEIKALREDGTFSGVGTRLIKAYPSFVADTPFRWGAKNEYVRFHIILTYLRWQPITEDITPRPKKS